MIYADHAATTQVLPEVFEKMRPFFSGIYANPSGMYRPARQAKQAIENAREEAARLIGAEPEEIIFTSGGTESDTWALRGGIKNPSGRKGLIISAFEHHAVLNTAESLKGEGIVLTPLSPQNNGIVSPSSLESNISSHTALVSIMYVNNEIGTIQPIRELSNVTHRIGAIFHTDAVAAIGSIPVDVKKDGIDLMSVSGHKFGAPKGIGFLYVRKGISLPPLFLGGAQEHSRRAGTENVASIVGLGEACRIAHERLNDNIRITKHLRDRLLHQINLIPETYVNGSLNQRIPGNLNVSFGGIEGESLVLLMDVKGICLSTGSACTSGFTQESHVLRSIGLERSLAKSAIRITLGPENTEEEIDIIANELSSAVKALRSLTPGWESK